MGIITSGEGLQGQTNVYCCFLKMWLSDMSQKKLLFKPQWIERRTHDTTTKTHGWCWTSTSSRAKSTCCAEFFCTSLRIFVMLLLAWNSGRICEWRRRFFLHKHNFMQNQRKLLSLIGNLMNAVKTVWRKNKVSRYD